jgi:toxin FitB
MNVVDSSAWLEYFADGPNAGFFAPAIEQTDQLIVPAICLYEVFKRVLQQRDEHAALQGVGQMRSGQVVNLDGPIAIDAASLGHQSKLAMADSIILATARRFDALLWTQDAHFETIPNVRFRRKAP